MKQPSSGFYLWAKVMNPLLLELQNSNNYIVSLILFKTYCICMLHNAISATCKGQKTRGCTAGIQYVNSRAFHLIEMPGQGIAQ